MDGRSRLDRSHLDPDRTGIVRPGARPGTRAEPVERRRRNRRTRPRPRRRNPSRSPRSASFPGRTSPPSSSTWSSPGWGRRAVTSRSSRPTRAASSARLPSSTSPPMAGPPSSCATSSSAAPTRPAPWRSPSASPASRPRRSIGASGPARRRPGRSPASPASSAPSWPASTPGRRGSEPVLARAHSPCQILSPGSIPEPGPGDPRPARRIPSSEQEVTQPPQPDRLAAGERLGVADADEVAPVAGPVADRVDHPRPALGLVVHQLRAIAPQAPRAWPRAASEMSRTRLGRSTIFRCTLK